MGWVVRVASLLLDTILDRIIIALVLILIVFPAAVIEKAAEVAGWSRLRGRCADFVDGLIRPRDRWY
jgi:hypothetical protein